MSTIVDFQQVKQAVSVENVLGVLQLKVKQHGDQWRGDCPICGAGPRQFVITTSKKLFHCFKCKEGGDMLKLTALTKKISIRDAALELAQLANITVIRKLPDKQGNASPSPSGRTGFDAERYLEGLDPAHAALEGLGLTADTLKEWKAGYSPSGVLRGRLALPIIKEGVIVGYIGRTLKDETPTLLFPNGITPSEFIFGSDRVTKGELYLVRDPLDVLKAFEGGIVNTVSFLTESISSDQLQYLSALMDEKEIDQLVIS